MERLYSNRGFRKVKRTGNKISYEVWSTGWFPKKLFEGSAPVSDFVNFLSED